MAAMPSYFDPDGGRSVPNGFRFHGKGGGYNYVTNTRKPDGKLAYLLRPVPYGSLVAWILALTRPGR
jgi:hypothetical protein